MLDKGKCVCCRKETMHWLTIKADQKLSFHVSPSMEKYPIDDDDGRYYRLFTCYDCSDKYYNGKSLKDIMYSNLLKKAANIPFN
jgi:hypothetical protein